MKDAYRIASYRKRITHWSDPIRIFYFMALYHCKNWTPHKKSLFCIGQAYFLVELILTNLIHIILSYECKTSCIFFLCSKLSDHYIYIRITTETDANRNPINVSARIAHLSDRIASNFIYYILTLSDFGSYRGIIRSVWSDKHPFDYYFLFE